MGPPLRGAVAHVFVADLAAGAIGDDDRHHLERVVRLRPGDEVTASDGEGSWVACRLLPGGRLEAEGPVEVDGVAVPPLTVAFSLVKGERPEMVVQKLTELGVDRIVAFPAARSVVRWEGDRADRNLERLRRVAREAAMQSRRTRLPAVEVVAGFDEVARLPGAALAEAGGGPPTLASPTLLVGPEGGWSPDELGCGLPTVALGATVLRAETAAVAAGVLLAALRAVFVLPVIASAPFRA